ncbi:MAG: glutamate--tRNA ligase [Clostridia bacterium]|nr:glutamate--tRNA ligase [Clostridia bacterium]
MNEKYRELANFIFPNINEKIKDLEKKYPERNMQEGEKVTRIAPSPTGFLHTGALFTALVNKRISKQTNGVFFLRIEDTDTKREVEGAAGTFINELNSFGISPDEGIIGEKTETGNYGPYYQSERKNIYKICAKELISKGLAYPCFCKSTDSEELRSFQEKEKIRPGYYGKFAKCRNMETTEAIKKIKNGEEYILRLRSKGNHLNKIAYEDKIRGKIEQAESDQDIVIIKSDGLPTYHFAHVCDDHFMRTSLVIRGEEWIASVPLHLQLFEMLEFNPVEYAHVPTLMVQDGNGKRKLSKRKDPEAACSYFLETGYPILAMIEYLLTIINSDFELWRKDNLDKDLELFDVKLDKMNVAGALFDIMKLNDISKEIIGRMNTETLYENAKEWSEKYDSKLQEKIISDSSYIKKILGIERENVIKVRKDFVKYSDIGPSITYFYDEEFQEDIKDGYVFSEEMKKDDIIEILKEYIKELDLSIEKDEWFNNLKTFTDKLGYSSNMKEYKKNKESYKGSIADVSSVIRIAVTNRKNTPDIYSIMKILGKEKVIERFNKVIDKK